MRRFGIGLFLVLHGLAHTALGMTAQDVAVGVAGDLPDAWRVACATLLFLGTTPTFVAAGFGAWGVPGLRRIWRPLTVGGALCSVALILVFAAPAGERVSGLWLDAVAVAMCGAFLRPSAAQTFA